MQPTVKQQVLVQVKWAGPLKRIPQQTHDKEQLAINEPTNSQNSKKN